MTIDLTHRYPKEADAVVDRYRHAVMMRSRSEDRWRTAVQHIDAYESWYAWQHWKREVEEALAVVRMLRPSR